MAADGQPGHPGIPDWPEYDEQTRSVMVFGEPTRLLEDPEGERRQVAAAARPYGI
ncbi:MAG TPA: hypothetical protein VFR07_14635 [Mycobacteriales bacterium]|jgi:para-nitrobenzyl esterase|nr:hypothetical protein [Mycobacteriales bacterium]